MSSHTTVPANATTNDRLDVIISHLERMDRRDRLRTVGGFLRSLLTLIPLVLFLGSAWYVYTHSTEIIARITAEAAKQAAGVAGGQGEEWQKTIEQYMGR